MSAHELSPESVLEQAHAFMQYHRKVGGHWRALFQTWAAGKDFAPADRSAVFKVLLASMGRRERAA